MGKIAKQLQEYLRPRNRPVVDLAAFAKMKQETSAIAATINTPDKLIRDGHDPLHALYASGQNMTSVFAEQVSPFRPLHPWHDFMTKNEDLYMPSGPPMSPLTASFYSFWTFFDAAFGKDKETIGTVLIALAKNIGLDSLQLEVIKNLSTSRMGIYEVLSANGEMHELSDFVTEKRFTAKIISGYHGKPGDLLYIRLAPPISCFDYHMCLVTPYVLVGNSKAEWLNFFRRNKIARDLVGCDYRLNQFMKHGKNLRFWAEYVFYSFVNFRSDRIFLTGLPDKPETQPCSDKFIRSTFNEGLIATQVQH